MSRERKPRKFVKFFSTSRITLAVLVVVILQLSWVQLVQCQNFDDYTSGSGKDFPVDNPEFVKYFTQVAYSRLSNLTTLLLSSQFANNHSYCVKDPKAEWNRAFNFSDNLDFVSNCITNLRGDFTQRICTAAEIKAYFNSIQNSNAIKPNGNCNRTSWVSGCEPGWACGVNSDQPIDLKNSRDIPVRTLDCQSCCAGFFCPRGITCMIPCPLGSYCPLATLNRSSGNCEPYNYQLPAGQLNHTCGGADMWSDVISSGAIFCSAGSYCPTSIEQTPCSSGNYCPMGSTSEKPCFKLASCDPNTASQNIHAYGAMLIAGLSTLLLIIYNCSDQVITIRERRLAKSREAAARSVREKVQARTRWKAAKDAAKKHAIELQSQVSRKFSRRKVGAENEKVRILNEEELGTDEDLYPTMDTSTSGASEQSYASSEGKTIEAGHLTRMMHEIEDHSDSFSSFAVDAKSSKSKAAKDKEIHTHSQIFKYAYSQLEKEKAQEQQNKNLTFSGVISMAANTETRKRPVIEIAFRDLTVTLKGKHKHLLRSVNGKIMPGRITAVMGPSGAGKTTFLSALAGKAVGCTINGLILVNGKTESIHSYKKIVGFVPQDDIVHGNLTVEENLWFSARCRLSADLPKPDKVLTVERVIESLGLQAVRSSLVGTVEKRGISGGQRKRVNVGLELVMEPSLLFLDEPTSGLDSSSSQLLLRAIRREALEGVNICMVVHQPSYTLFRMFDDLILLAKGGLTVYHGSVRKVEEYFTSLGINVPERVNPPDYFIDVLEGLVKPNTSSSLSHEELPIRWMLYNGYPVPPDMQHYSVAVTASPTYVQFGSHEYSAQITNEDQSFAGEMWQDVKCNMERRRDIIRHNFLRSKDLSNRRTPNVLLQYKYFLGRVGKQRLREARVQAIDYLILLLAGASLGSLSKASEEQFGMPGYTYSIIAVSLLCKIAALRSFSMEKLQHWRESASGMSSLAYFVSKDTMDHFNTAIKPVVYLSMYYFFNNPRSPFMDNYIVLLCLVYCVTGIAYVLAIFLDPGPSQLCSVILPVVLTLVATQARDNKVLKIISDFCYPKWALEAFVIGNAERYYGVWIITRCGTLRRFDYNLHDWILCIAILILTGIASRGIAFLGMLVFQRK
ncbi:ABC transporter G family member 28-like isoform X1 [Coffea arabica]|uniref:ABC transporter G family member 28-like isoform X1 n=1 Tax=Coffea arabica TaxID=13443 RepID=A0A6P6VSL9_COFAR